MKRILSILVVISALLIFFQNCGGKGQLPVSLGDSSSILSTRNINFPFSWSTDTGNFDHENKTTPLTAIRDLADSVCFLYSEQLKISKEECSQIIRLDPQFINLFHNLKVPYESFEKLESDSNNGFIKFDKKSGDACLLYIDSHQIQITNSEPDQIYSVIASSANCSNVVYPFTIGVVIGEDK